MKVFSKCFRVTAFMSAIALALAGCYPQVESVVVNSNGANSIRKGDTMNFGAAVTGKNNPSQNVKWSVSSKSDGSGAVADGTNISPGGTLIVDAKETAANIYVRATASQSEDKYDYVQLKVESASSAQRTAATATPAAQTTQTSAQEASVSSAATSANATATPTAATPASISVPAGTKKIADHAYRDKGLTSVTIPNGVTEIGFCAFMNNQLTSVTIPNGVTIIGDSAFSANRLTSVTIPSSVTVIGSQAFSGNQLTSVTISNGVTRIGSGAFAGNKLTTVTIPASLTSIEGLDNANHHPFDRNPALAAINVDPANPVYSSADGVLYNKDKTKLLFWPPGKKTVIIPSSVTTIGSSAFGFCETLTSVTIPNSVTTIEWAAFHPCPLTVTIPAGVKNVGKVAFAGAKSVTFERFPTTIGDQAFIGADRVYFKYPVNKLDFSPVMASGVDIKFLGDLHLVYDGIGTYVRNGYKWARLTATNTQPSAVTYDYSNEVIANTRLYADHSVNSSVIKTINKGERVNTGAGFTDSAGKIWIPSEHSGSKGWIPADDLDGK